MYAHRGRAATFHRHLYRRLHLGNEELLARNVSRTYVLGPWTARALCQKPRKRLTNGTT